MMPALMISYRPARYSRSGSVSSTRGIDQHCQRLMEAADQVLAADQVYAGLAADGGIHLCQQRRGHLHHRNATHENGGEESSHIADDAAPERDHDAGAIAAAVRHLFGRTFDTHQPLLFFARSQKNGVVNQAAQAGAQTIPVEAPNVLIGNDEHLPGPCRDELENALQHAALDNGRVPLRRNLHLENRHIKFVPRVRIAGRAGAGAARCSLGAIPAGAYAWQQNFSPPFRSVG